MVGANLVRAIRLCACSLPVQSFDNGVRKIKGDQEEQGEVVFVSLLLEMHLQRTQVSHAHMFSIRGSRTMLRAGAILIYMQAAAE